MAHFAELDNTNTVLRVIVISNDIVADPAPDNEQAGIDFINNVLQFGGIWKQTSYNANFRGCYAGIGYTFDPSIGEYGEFVPPPIIENDQA